jgi:DNA polymerase III delta subunit
MLYVFFGTDVVAIRRHAYERVHREEAEGSVVRTVTTDTFETGVVRSLLSSVSLFGGRECIVFDTLSEQREAYEELMEARFVSVESPHTVIVIEGSQTASDAALFKKAGAEMHEYKGATKERFNTFLLTDALLKRDKKMLWILLVRARNAGIPAEEIIGTLLWQLKALRLAHITTNATEADMKEFPYTKAKQSLKKFPPRDLYDLSQKLVTLYHEGHLSVDIDLALEKWILGV